MKRYAHVQDGKITKTRQVDEKDSLLIGKMQAHGYLPIEAGATVIDGTHQKAVGLSYQIMADRVIENVVVEELPDTEVRELAIWKRIEQIETREHEARRKQAIEELKAEKVLPDTYEDKG